MLEPQGPRPLDPYRALRLHAQATRPLIVEAYWHLASRVQRNGARDGERIVELNAAYALLIDAEARQTYDEAHGLAALERPRVTIERRGGGLFGGGHTEITLTGVKDHYHLLRIDREADEELIGIAYRMLRNELRESTVEAEIMREALEEAHRTLRNPMLRARYDASPSDEEAAPAAGKTNAIAPRAYDEWAGLVSAAAAAQEQAAPAAASNGAGEAVNGRKNGQNEAERGVAAALPAAAGVKDASLGPGGRGDARTPRAVRDGRDRGLLGWLRGEQKATAAEPANRAATPLPAGREADDARDARLRTLRADDPAPADGAASDGERAPASEPEEGAATLTFVAGPLAGSRVVLGGEAVTLGSSVLADVVLAGARVGQEHARIWQHGQHFVLHQMEGCRTRVAGEPLTLPLVMLDDGDEIEIGPHRLRFALGTARREG